MLSNLTVIIDIILLVIVSKMASKLIDQQTLIINLNI